MENNNMENNNMENNNMENKYTWQCPHCGAAGNDGKTCRVCGRKITNCMAWGSKEWPKAVAAGLISDDENRISAYEYTIDGLLGVIAPDNNYHVRLFGGGKRLAIVEWDSYAGTWRGGDFEKFAKHFREEITKARIEARNNR